MAPLTRQFQTWKTFPILAIFLFFLAFPHALSAQAKSGRIIGIVVDSETGDPIIGANVIIEGTMRGAAADIEGKYTILHVEPGTHTVIISAISYGKKIITGVVVGAGETVTIDGILAPEAIQTEEVVVEARALLSYEAALLRLQQRSAHISDGISAEQIRRTPDATSSDALRRVTGLSVVDNKFVFVRGISERYNKAMLNGGALASTEPDRKAFAFDMVPANLLENTIISKSFTPDMPGDFAGGLLRMNTIDFPPDLIVTVSGSASYNTITTFDNFKSYNGGSRDYLGIDDGSRKIPTGIPGDVGSTSITPQERLEIAEKFPNTWGVTSRKAPVSNSYSISFGDGTRLLGQDFGFVTALSYRSGFDNVRMERNEYEASGEPRFLYNGVQSKYSVLWGGMFNFSYKISNFHKLSVKNTYTRSADDEVTELRGPQFTDISSELIHTAMRYVSRSVYSGQLAGEHYFRTLGGLQLDWRISRSISDRDEPDYRRIIYARSFDANESDPYYAVLGFQANMKNGGRFYSKLNDKSNAFAADFVLPLRTVQLKFGGSFDQTDRDFTSRLIGIIINARGNGFTDPELYYLPSELIFSTENFRRNGFSIDEYRNGGNNYTAAQSVSAAYAMVDLPFTVLNQEFRLIAGARWEESRQEVNTMNLNATEEIHVDRKKANILPSLNLVYRITQASNIRAAYSETVNRPELREISNFMYFDFSTQTSVRGNTGLRPAGIRNYDLRFETFPGFEEMFSASVFYKDITDAIEQVVIAGVSLNAERTFMNADKAKNYGFEIEGRLSLKRIADILSNFSIRGNYAWIKSEVSIGGTETTIGRTGRPLQGQSPYVINLGLLYDNTGTGTSVNLLYNKFGKRVMEISTSFEGELVEMPRDIVDVVVTQRLFTSFEFKLTAKDILDQEQRFMQEDLKIGGNLRGSSYSLGISYKF
jgi:TonB-dependent receptor